MRRRLIVIGVLLATLYGVTVSSQPFATQIQQAINLLTRGTTPFTAFRTATSSYINWGTVQGVAGYGFRDNAGTLEVKQQAGTWIPINPTGAGNLDATYILQTPAGDLPNAQSLSALGTALLRNTTTTGVLVAYTGTTCTNQFVRVLSAVGVATCASVALGTDVTGTLPVANGGTGLTSGTSGGLLYFSGGGTIASSAALTVNRLLLGGGAGAAPSPLGSLGTTTTVLHGNAAGAPTFGAVDLATDVTSILDSANGGTGNGFFVVSGPATSPKTFTFPNANATILTTGAAVTPAQGGTGITSYAIGDVIYADGATSLAKLAGVSTGNALISGGVTTAPSWGKVGLATHVSGILPVANGGTGLATFTTGDLLYASATTTVAGRAAVAVGQTLISQGVGTAPIWSAALRISTISLGPDLAWSATAPTIGSGFGTSPSVTAGTSASFRVNVGTGGTATNGVLALPTATTGWNCHVENLTGVLGNVADQRTVQIASTTASVTVENQTVSTGAALAWTASDVLALTCTAF